MFGALIVVAAVLYAAAVVLQAAVFGAKLPPGLTLIVLLNVLFIGTTMMSLGIIGGYIFRVYQEVLRRPRYLVTQQVNLTGAPLEGAPKVSLPG